VVARVVGVVEDRAVSSNIFRSNEIKKLIRRMLECHSLNPKLS
jgi:hypothetical protein